MDTRDLGNFPSSIKKFSIASAGRNYDILLPENEEFRLREIFNNNGYYFPGVKKLRSPKVLDVGANVGLFSMYIKLLNPSALIECFEPAADTFQLLKSNTLPFEGINIHQVGLSDVAGQAEINVSSLSTGQTSMKNIAAYQQVTRQTIELIEARSAMAVSEKVDILKIDTEGCEYEILKNLRDHDLLQNINFIMLEYHSEKDRRRIDQLLDGFTIFGYQSSTINLGLMKFVRTDLLGTDICSELNMANPL